MFYGLALNGESACFCFCFCVFCPLNLHGVPTFPFHQSGKYGLLALKVIFMYSTGVSTQCNAHPQAVDYRGISQSSKFEAYVRATAELKRVDLTNLSR